MRQTLIKKPFLLLSILEHMLKNISRDDVDKDDLAVLVLDAFKKASKYEASWQKFQTRNEKNHPSWLYFQTHLSLCYKPSKTIKKSVREQT